MDYYADDLADLTQHLDLHDAVHVGHSAGGGKVARYIGRHGETRVAKVALISAVTPSVLQTDANPAGVPRAAFEGLQAQLAANRSEFYRAVPSGPFYNFDQPGVTALEAIIANWWRQGMMGGAPEREGPRPARFTSPLAPERYGHGRLVLSSNYASSRPSVHCPA